MEFINFQEKLQIQRILAKSSLLQTADDRRNFLTFCGIEKHFELQLDQSIGKFVISLLVQLLKMEVVIDNYKKLGLIVFLEYLNQLDYSLSPEDQDFIKYIQSKWEQEQANRTGVSIYSRKMPDLSCPYNLPSMPSLIGREKDIEAIQNAIVTEASLIVIEGIGGIGKTSLATFIANQLCKANQFDQVVWVSAKGRSVNLPTLLDEIAVTIDYPYISQLSLFHKKQEIIKFLRLFSCLLLFDNFDTVSEDAKEELFSFLLSIPSPSKTIVTTRPPLPGEQLVPSGAYIVIPNKNETE